MAVTQLPTRERIIEIAGDIFGRNGFKSTTIRMIANEAGVNVAAVNYHFGDKEGLYAEVLDAIFSAGFTRFPSDSGLTREDPADIRLKAFIRGTLYRLLSHEGWGGLQGKARLIAREMLDPTAEFIRIVDRYIKPHKDMLVDILSRLVPLEDEPERILLCCVSILGQCIYYVYATSIIEQVANEYMPLEDNIDRIVDHVFEFSLGGIEKIKRSKEGA